MAELGIARGHDVTIAARGQSGRPPEGARFEDVERILFEHSEVEWGFDLFLGRAPEHA